MLTGCRCLTHSHNKRPNEAAGVPALAAGLSQLSCPAGLLEAQGVPRGSGAWHVGEDDSFGEAFSMDSSLTSLRGLDLRNVTCWCGCS